MDIIAPVLTPFRGDRVDLEKFGHHASNILKKGVDALFVAGTTGLGPALSLEEKKTLLEAAAGLTKRVIMQVGSLRHEEVLELLSYSRRFDVEAVASVPPYYFPRLSERQVAKYFKNLCARSPHPVYLYNYPAAVGRDVHAQLAKQIGCISGVKDTSEELAHTLAYKRLMPAVKVYNGADNLIAPAFAAGLDGVVASAANYLPEALRAMKEAAAEGDLRKAMAVQSLLYEVLEVARPLGYLAAVYELVEAFQGYAAGEPRPPIYPLEDEERRSLRGALEGVRERLRGLI